MDDLYKPTARLLKEWGVTDPEHLLQSCDNTESVIKDLLSIHAALRRLYPARNSESLYQIDIMRMRNRDLDSCRPVDLIQEDIQENAAVLRRFYEGMLQR